MDINFFGTMVMVSLLTAVALLLATVIRHDAAAKRIAKQAEAEANALKPRRAPITSNNPQPLSQTDERRAAEAAGRRRDDDDDGLAESFLLGVATGVPLGRNPAAAMAGAAIHHATAGDSTERAHAAPVDPTPERHSWGSPAPAYDPGPTSYGGGDSSPSVSSSGGGGGSSD